MSKKLNKVCVICGDKASGFNFNAITCESCKAFFRRNASKEKSLRCFLGGNCSIDMTNRKYCKKCRLDKCIAMGMLAELILSEKQKELRQKKIKENKKIKIMDELTKIEYSGVDSSPSPMMNTEPEFEGMSKEFFEINFDINLNKADNSSQNIIIDEIQETVYREAVQLEFSILPFERPKDSNKGFNDLEESRFQELQNAMTAFDCPYPQFIESLDEYFEAIQVITLKSDLEIRNTVKMCKQISSFRSICERDQLILLKYASIEILCLRVANNLDFQTMRWTIITDTRVGHTLDMEVLRQGKRNFYVDLRVFYSKLGAEWDNDMNIVNLLTAIVLFDPKRPRLSQIEPIKFQQQIYMYLLQRYLQNKYQSDSNSITKFLRLLNSLNDLHIVNDKLSQNWSEGDPNRILPLLREVSTRNDM